MFSGGGVTMIYNYENRLAVHQAPETLATDLHSDGGPGEMRIQIVDGAISTMIWKGRVNLARLFAATLTNS
jgi:hypothetical protein